MKNILIIGARGFGRTVHNHLQKLYNFNTEFRIKGFLDDKVDALLGYKNYAPILSSVEDYKICNDDLFICSLGNVNYKKKYSNIILDKGFYVNSSTSKCSTRRTNRSWINYFTLVCNWFRISNRRTLLNSKFFCYRS